MFYSHLYCSHYDGFAEVVKRVQKETPLVGHQTTGRTPIPTVNNGDISTSVRGAGYFELHGRCALYVQF